MSNLLFGSQLKNLRNECDRVGIDINPEYFNTKNNQWVFLQMIFLILTWMLKRIPSK